ncbi:homoserine dehydrogenase [Anaerosolibacter carboniphilus]|uniref:Homoserine dehydrogenase n=1 Tax=Anaerosolibacter carboniphilus TaxID=1417629 RepID=A0A841KQM9_9FIRM|nr:homoserine dehydrogenase [Anaerosolibacter carboniphilus]MBB6214400.1 homoserine dehydrogenase [Anaerosolibacter carboniphilus]
MKTLKIAMVGFGNAGKALARIILDKQKELSGTLEWELKIVAITTGSRGNLVDEKGIDLNRALQDLERQGSFDRQWEAYREWSTMEIIERVDYDVLIEISPLNIFTGQPAIEHINTAFGRRKHVITANKGPIAWAYHELISMAEKQRVHFFHETTVMDGTPVFNLVDETLPMCRVTGIKGILNTTTNFILEEMAEGKSFEDAVEEGKRRGFVEADPSMDIEGWDAAAKTAALLNVLMHANITPRDIQRKGIEDITHEDILRAQREGKVIKLICQGRVENGQVVGVVKPMEISKDHVFASVTGTSSILSIKTDLMGELTIIEHDPEIEQTGYGLFSDLLRLIRKL